MGSGVAEILKDPCSPVDTGGQRVKARVFQRTQSQLSPDSAAGNCLCKACSVSRARERGQLARPGPEPGRLCLAGSGSVVGGAGGRELGVLGWGVQSSTPLSDRGGRARPQVQILVLPAPTQHLCSTPRLWEDPSWWPQLFSMSTSIVTQPAFPACVSLLSCLW